MPRVSETARREVHRHALELLASLGFPATGMHSKSWDVFAVAGPMTAHWGVPDPAAVEGSEKEKRTAFRAAFAELENRIRLFTTLPFAALDRPALQRNLDAIGCEPGSAAA